MTRLCIAIIKMLNRCKDNRLADELRELGESYDTRPRWWVFGMAPCTAEEAVMLRSLMAAEDSLRAARPE